MLHVLVTSCVDNDPNKLYVSLVGATRFSDRQALDVIETCHDRIRHMQVPETASSLNSGDSFVLLTPTDVYLWVGNGCSAEESHAAEEISKVFFLSCATLAIGGRRPSQLDQYRYFLSIDRDNLNV